MGKPNPVERFAKELKECIQNVTKSYALNLQKWVTKCL